MLLDLRRRGLAQDPKLAIGDGALGFWTALTVNATRPLPEPLLSRCPPIRLPQLTTSDLTGFARRQGARRGLSDVGIEVIVEAIEASAGPVQPISLRTVMRMIARAETLEAGPRQH